MRILISWLALLLLCVGTALAEPAGTSTQPTTQPADSSKQPRVVQMTLQATVEPDPALKYQLLPSGLDLTEEDALPLYYSGTEHIGTKLEERKQIDRVEELLNVPVQDLPKDEVHKILKDYADMLKHIDIAARRTYINWDLGVDKLGYELLLPPLSKWRKTAKLVALQARLEIAEGRYDDVIHTLQTGYAMARHAAAAPNLIQALVGISIAELMSWQVEAFIQAPEAPNLYWALATLPKPLVDLRTGIEFERIVLYLSVPELQRIRSGNLSPQEWQELPAKLAATMDIGNEPEEKKDNWWNRAGVAGLAAKYYPQARQYWLKRGFTDAQIEAMPVQQVVLTYALTKHEQIRDDIIKWFNVPYWQGIKELEEASNQLEDPVKRFQGAPFTFFLSNLIKAYAIHTASDEHIAALQTIEALRMYAANHNGQLPQSLDQIQEAPTPLNPVTGQFFEYHADGNRFTLDASAPKEVGDRGTRYEITISR